MGPCLVLSLVVLTILYQSVWIRAGCRLVIFASLLVGDSTLAGLFNKRAWHRPVGAERAGDLVAGPGAEAESNRSLDVSPNLNRFPGASLSEKS